MDADSLQATPWSAQYSDALPQQWLNRKEKVFGIAFDPIVDHTASTRRALLYDHACFCVIDFTKPPPGPGNNNYV